MTPHEQMELYDSTNTAYHIDYIAFSNGDKEMGVIDVLEHGPDWICVRKSDVVSWVSMAHIVVIKFKQT